jgi:hypothetical protein
LPRQTDGTEVALVESEYGLDSFAVRQVEQRDVGDLEFQVFVGVENCRDWRKVRLVERAQMECAILY